MVSVDSRVKLFTTMRVLEELREKSNVVHGLMHDPSRHHQGEKLRDFFDNVPELLRKCYLALRDVHMEVNDFLEEQVPTGEAAEPFDILLDSMDADDDGRLLFIPGVDE